MTSFGIAGHLSAGWGLDLPAVFADPLMWLIAGLFCLFEEYTIDLPFKSHRHSYSMTEIPTVIGFFYLAPDALIVAAVLGTTADFVFFRRQPLLKLSFNIALQFSNAVLQLLIFEAVASSRTPTDATAMVAVYAAVTISAVGTHCAVSSAISFVEGLRARAMFWRGMWFSIVMQLANGSFGLIAVHLVEIDWAAIFILVTPVLVMFIAYRAMAKRMETEEKLRASERRFAALIQASSDITVLIGADGALQYVSEAAVELLGIDTSEIRGAQVMEMFDPTPEQAEHFRQALDGALQGNDPVELNVLARRPDGSELELEVKLTNLLLDPSVEAVLLSARDATQRRRLEDRLLQAQKMDAIGHLAGGVAHDFNNLLAVIQNYASFVKGDLPPGSSSHEDIDEIIRATETASSLTRQLLSFARKEVVSPRVINVNDLVSSMHRMLARTIRESIELRTSLAPDISPVEIDPGRLEQVLINLAVNAKDAMPEGGSLVIRTYETYVDPVSAGDDRVGGRHVVVSVTDTGMGMTEEVREHIFEPFFTTKDKGKGTGLGLATVYGIVNQFNGQIEVESEPGAGTEFRIYLPASTGRVSEPSEDVTSHEGGERGTILIAEDSEPLRKLLERILSKESYKVFSAGSGADAFRLWQQRSSEIDLLVTDVVMPQMSGRELSELTGVPTIFISGYTDEIISQEDVTDGGFFLQKPFSGEDLLRVVAEALRTVARTRAK